MKISATEKVINKRKRLVLSFLFYDIRISDFCSFRANFSYYMGSKILLNANSSDEPFISFSIIVRQKFYYQCAKLFYQPLLFIFLMRRY